MFPCRPVTSSSRLSPLPASTLMCIVWCVWCKGSSKYYVIKRCHQLVWVGVGGQANYDVMMVFCGNALQQHHKTLNKDKNLSFIVSKYFAFDFSALILALDHTLANRLHRDFLQWRYHTLAYCRWWMIDIHKFCRKCSFISEIFSLCLKFSFE